MTDSRLGLGAAPHVVQDSKPFRDLHFTVQDMLRLLVSAYFHFFPLPRSAEQTVHLLTENILKSPFSTRLFPNPPCKSIHGGLLQI